MLYFFIIFYFIITYVLVVTRNSVLHVHEVQCDILKYCIVNYVCAVLHTPVHYIVNYE